MPVMNLPQLPVGPGSVDKCVSLYLNRLPADDALWPRASLLLTAYMAWPDDEPTSADAPSSPEVPRLQAGEAAVTTTTVIEALLSLECTDTPPSPAESLPTEGPVTAGASTEVPRSPEEPTQP